MGWLAPGRRSGELYRQHEMVTGRPKEIVAEYLRDIMTDMGIEASDNWQVWHHNRHISWGRFLGLQRCHWHVAHGLSFFLRGQVHEGQAYLTTLLRSLHQVCLDGGSWDTASLMMPVSDPIDKTRFGGSHAQLEVVAVYKDAVRKLEKAHTQTDHAGAGGSKKKKGDGQGGDKGGGGNGS